MSAFALSFRREYEPFMLNGDAHHSVVWEVEPRIWPLLNCQRRPNPKTAGHKS